MDKDKSNVAQQVALAAIAFQTQRTGHAPRAVTVVLGQETLVVTLHDALSPAEKILARSPAGAAQVLEFHKVVIGMRMGLIRTFGERRPVE